MTDRLEAAEAILATVSAAQHRALVLAHRHLDFRRALAIEMALQVGRSAARQRAAQSAATGLLSSRARARAIAQAAAALPPAQAIPATQARTPSPPSSASSTAPIPVAPDDAPEPPSRLSAPEEEPTRALDQPVPVPQTLPPAGDGPPPDNDASVNLDAVETLALDDSDDGPDDIELELIEPHRRVMGTPPAPVRDLTTGPAPRFDDDPDFEATVVATTGELLAALRSKQGPATDEVPIEDGALSMGDPADEPTMGMVLDDVTAHGRPAIQLGTARPVSPTRVRGQSAGGAAPDPDEPTAIRASPVPDPAAQLGPPPTSRPPPAPKVPAPPTLGVPRVVEARVSDPKAEPAGAAAIQILGVGRARTITPTLELGGAPDEDEYSHIRRSPMAEDDALSLSFEEPEEEASEHHIPELTEGAEVEPSSTVISADGVMTASGSSVVDAGMSSGKAADFLAAARTAQQKGNLRDAVIHFSDLLSHDPHHFEGHLGRGRCLVDLGDFSAAMSDFTQAEDLAPDAPEPAVEMGNLFFARKEYTRALRYYTHAIEMDPQHAMAFCRRGICHYYRRSYPEAVADLEQAERVDPSIQGLQRYIQMARRKQKRGR